MRLLAGQCPNACRLLIGVPLDRPPLFAFASIVMLVERKAQGHLSDTLCGWSGCGPALQANASSSLLWQRFFCDGEACSEFLYINRLYWRTWHAGHPDEGWRESAVICTCAFPTCRIASCNPHDCGIIVLASQHCLACHIDCIITSST